MLTYTMYVNYSRELILIMCKAEIHFTGVCTRIYYMQAPQGLHVDVSVRF